MSKIMGLVGVIALILSVLNLIYVQDLRYAVFNKKQASPSDQKIKKDVSLKSRTSERSKRKSVKNKTKSSQNSAIHSKKKKILKKQKSKTTKKIKLRKRKIKKAYISKSKPSKRMGKHKNRKKGVRKSRKPKKIKFNPQTDPINWDLPEIDFD